MTHTKPVLWPALSTRDFICCAIIGTVLGLAIFAAGMVVVAEVCGL